MYETKTWFDKLVHGLLLADAANSKAAHSRIQKEALPLSKTQVG